MAADPGAVSKQADEMVREEFDIQFGRLEWSKISTVRTYTQSRCVRLRYSASNA